MDAHGLVKIVDLPEDEGAINLIRPEIVLLVWITVLGERGMGFDSEEDFADFLGWQCPDASGDDDAAAGAASP